MRARLNNLLPLVISGIVGRGGRFLPHGHALRALLPGEYEAEARWGVKKIRAKLTFAPPAATGGFDLGLKIKLLGAGGPKGQAINLTLLKHLGRNSDR